MGLTRGFRANNAVAATHPGVSDGAKATLLLAVAAGALSYSYLSASYAQEPAAAPDPISASASQAGTVNSLTMAEVTPVALPSQALAQGALAHASLPSSGQPALVARHEPAANIGVAQHEAVVQSASLAAPALRVRGPVGPSAFRLQAPDLTATGYVALRERNPPITWSAGPARTPPATRGLQDLERELTAPLPMATWDAPRVFLFAASDDEAVIWTPSASPTNGGVARGGSLAYVEDQVEVGEVHAGVGIEAEGLRLSVGYTEHDVETRFGNRGESYAGFNLTWRR